MSHATSRDVLSLPRLTTSLAEYRMRFAIDTPGEYEWIARLMDDDAASRSAETPAYDPALGLWWVLVLSSVETGQVVRLYPGEGLESQAG